MNSQEIFSQKSPEDLLGTSETCWYVRPDDTKSHKKNKTGPCRRWGHSSGIVNTKLIVYGGTGYTTNPRHWESVYQLDLENWDWLKLEALNKPPPSRDSHSCVSYQNKLYFFGGSNGTDSIDEMMEYDLESNLWRKPPTKGIAPSAREGHSACLFQDRYIVIFGGWNGEDIFNDCFLFDILEATWVPVVNRIGSEPSAREGQSCCILRNGVYLFGGQGNTVLKDGVTVEEFCNDLYKLQIDFEDQKVIATWEKLEVADGLKPPKRSSHASCTYQDRYMFILGGEGYPPGFDETNPTNEYKRQQTSKGDKDHNQICHAKNDVWYLDIDQMRWYQVAIKNEKDFMPRFAHSCHNFKDYIIVFGGLQDYNHSTNDICVLSLEGSDPFVTQLYARGKSQSHYGAAHRKGQGKNSFGKGSQVKLTKSESMQSEDGGGSEYKAESMEEISPVPDQKSKKSVQKKEGTPPPSSDMMIQEEYSIGTPSEMTKKTGFTHSHEGPIVSLSFVSSLSGLISWPLAAFGLLVDNALMNGTKNLKIDYLVRSPREYGVRTNGESEKPGNPGAAVYIQVDDDGVGLKHEDFMKVLMNYICDLEESKSEEGEGDAFEEAWKKKLHDYGLNLKLAGFRLGKTIIYLSRNGDEVSVGFISGDKKFNPDIHKNHIFYYSWNKTSGEFLTNFAVKHKKIIFNALRGIITEEELLDGIDNISNRVIIVDLNPVVVMKQSKGIVKNYELFMKKEKKGGFTDLGVRTLDTCLQGFKHGGPTPLIELSLWSYLSHFFLDGSQVDLKVSLNGKQIEFINYKELITKKAEKAQRKYILNHEGCFKGLILKNFPSQVKQETPQEVKAEIQVLETLMEDAQEKNIEECYQGILLYFNNRLVRRLESARLGNIDYLSLQYRILKQKCKGAMTFEADGYIELEDPFKPNLFGTEIENPYYSNYLLESILSKMKEIPSLNGKRPCEFLDDNEGFEEITKKVKLSN